MPKPEGWPDELVSEVMYSVDIHADIPFVPLADGRLTSKRQTIKVDFRDSDNHLELDVVVVQGQVRLVQVVLQGGDLPLSSLRHHKLAQHIEAGLSMTTTPTPTADNVRLTLTGPSPAARKAVRKAMRLRVDDALLDDMLGVYRAAGGGGDGVRAVQQRWPGTYRHRDRQVKQAMRREHEQAGAR